MAVAAVLNTAPRVLFRGPLTRPALSAAYARADAVLFPVRWQEPFGLVPLEAMARGTPVIGASAGGSAAYRRDRRTALVVPPDPAALAAAVERLQADEALRATPRGAGRPAAEAYPAERSHALISAALCGCCKDRSGPSRKACRGPCPHPADITAANQKGCLGGVRANG